MNLYRNRGYLNALCGGMGTETDEEPVKLVDKVTKPTPNKKRYSVSVDDIINVPKYVEIVGESVSNLSWKVQSLLTGG